ncbi:MAG TPA: matrixin family metalloprotease, partial [Terriglobia bacterium]|nr:matrixin family metalloprotease [Terriglobia bacterium]
LQALAPDSGTWQVTGGALQVAATSLHSDAVAVYQVGDALPSYFEVLATVKAIKPTAGWNANSYIIFDYQSATNFKFAGIDVSTNKLVMGHRNASGWIVDSQAAFQGGVKSDTWYNLMLSVNGLTATLIVDNTTSFSFTYAPTIVDGWSYGLNWGLVGFGSNNSRGAMDTIAVQIVPPAATVSRTDEFFDASNTLFDGAGSGGSFVRSGGRYVGTPSGMEAVIGLANISGVTNLSASSILDLNAKFNTTARAGFVFDQYSETDYKWAAIDIQTQKVLIGHRVGNNWVIDASVSKTLVAGTDYTLGLTLRGSTVSVTLDGQTLVSYAYNAITIDGRFGVFAKGGTIRVDTMTVKTNDPAIPAALMASAAPESLTSESTLDEAQLEFIAEAARTLWLEALGSSDLVAVLDQVQFQIVSDLPGLTLAWAVNGNTIVIDATAAGYGWFVDFTPFDDSEFSQPGGTGEASGQMDLLTAVVHEFGHILGFAHTDTVDVMYPTLASGTRSLEWETVSATETASTPTLIDWDNPTSGLAVGWSKTPLAPGFPNFGRPDEETAASGSLMRKAKRWQANADMHWHVEV